MVVLSSVAVVHVRRVAKSTNARAVFFFFFSISFSYSFCFNWWIRSRKKEKNLSTYRKPLALSLSSRTVSNWSRRRQRRLSEGREGRHGVAALGGGDDGDTETFRPAGTPSPPITQGFCYSVAISSSSSTALLLLIDEFLAFLFLTVSEARKPRYQRLFVSFALFKEKKEGTALLLVLLFKTKTIQDRFFFRRAH